MDSIDWDRTDPFVIDVTVEEQHIDGYGHVSTPHYVQWMIDCAFQHSTALGLPESACREMNRGMAAVDFEVKLLGSAYLGDRIRVATWISRNDGKLRLSRHMQVVDSETGRTLARAEFHFVCTNLETGKPVRLPELFRQVYAVESEAVIRD